MQETPDRTNVYFRKIKQESGCDALNAYEGIFIWECDSLKKGPVSCPVSFIFHDASEIHDMQLHTLNICFEQIFWLAKPQAM